MPSSKSEERREDRDRRKDDRPSQSRQSSGRSRTSTVRDTEDTSDRPDQGFRQPDDKPSEGKLEKYKYASGAGGQRDRSVPQSSMPMSSTMSATGHQIHLPDQFPGQVPQEFSLPFRPPIATTESFGEASAYYGDQGESVHHQPGVRPGTPIVANTQLHLQPASSVANPVQDTGNGSAADFYGSNSQTSAIDARYPAPHPTTLPGIPGVPNATNIPSIPMQPPAYNSPASSSFPSKGQSSNLIDKPRPSFSQHGSSYADPLAIGAAGLAVAGYAHHQYQSHESASNSQDYHSSSYAMGNNSQRPYSPHTHTYRPDYSPNRHTRRRGPLGRFAEWWNDHEDVRKMEEYTEYIGVCRDCFDPHSSAGDAPRRHHHHRRGVREERHRIDKDSRYSSSSSDSESSRRRRSARRRHSPRLARRSSDQRSSTSYGVIESERDTSRKDGSKHDGNGRFVRTDSSEFIEVDSNRRADHRTERERERRREPQSAGFFGSFFSPSSTRDRSTRRHEVEFGESDIERRSMKRKREQDHHRPTTTNAAEALAGLGVAAATLAAVNRRGEHHSTSHAELMRRDNQYRRTSSHRRYSGSEESWESASDSGSSSSINSALAYGDDNYGRPAKRRGSHSSASSGTSGSGSRDWRSRRKENGRRNVNRPLLHDQNVEVLFDQDKVNDGRDSRTQPGSRKPELSLQLVEPQPWSPGPSQIAQLGDVQIHSPQPISPPKTFANFQGSGSSGIDRPAVQHTKSEPAGSFQAQSFGTFETDMIVSRAEIQNVRDISRRQTGLGETVSMQDAVFGTTGMALAGAVIGALAKSPRTRERKASVRFANVDSDEEQHDTAQHHSRSGSHGVYETAANAIVDGSPSMPRTSSIRDDGPLSMPRMSSTRDDDDAAGPSKDSSFDSAGHFTIADIRPTNQYRKYEEPILDDDLNDPNFFKKSREKVRAEDANQDQEVSDMFADLEDRYSKDKAAQSQADFFRPASLSSSSKLLDRRADTEIDDSSDYVPRPNMPRQSSVPVLRVISATPPPDPVAASKRRPKENRPSPLNATVESDPEAEQQVRSDTPRDSENDASRRDASRAAPSIANLVNRDAIDDIDEDVERHTPGGFVDDNEPSTEQVQQPHVEQSNAQGQDMKEETVEEQQDEDNVDLETPSKVRTIRRRSSKKF
jgi:hypothetical protein